MEVSGLQPGFIITPCNFLYKERRSAVSTVPKLYCSSRNEVTLRLCCLCWTSGLELSSNIVCSSRRRRSRVNGSISLAPSVNTSSSRCSLQVCYFCTIASPRISRDQNPKCSALSAAATSAANSDSTHRRAAITNLCKIFCLKKRKTFTMFFSFKAKLHANFLLTLAAALKGLNGSKCQLGVVSPVLQSTVGTVCLLRHLCPFVTAVAESGKFPICTVRNIPLPMQRGSQTAESDVIARISSCSCRKW